MPAVWRCEVYYETRENRFCTIKKNASLQIAFTWAHYGIRFFQMSLDCPVNGIIFA